MLNLLLFSVGLFKAKSSQEEGCKGWANAGECRENPRFMLAECRKECIEHIPWGASSRATLEECQKWADEDYECSENIAFMNLHCADQCGHQWRYVPEVRSALGLSRTLPQADSSIQQQLIINNKQGGPEVIDLLSAAEWQCIKLENIILNGEKSSYDDLADNSRGFVRGFAGVLLYAARMIHHSELASIGKAALVADDANRRDWVLRKAPEFVITLRSAIDIAKNERNSQVLSSYESLRPYERLVRRRVRSIASSSQQQNEQENARNIIQLKYSKIDMPLLGLGTCWLTEQETEIAVGAVINFLNKNPEIPAVHIDSAEAYRNEAAIGRVLKTASESIRSKLFLASKLSDERWLSYDGARMRVQDALQKFGTQSIHLFSLHSSFAFKHSASRRERIREAWRGLISCVEEGKIQALGLSNFNEAELRDFALDTRLGGLFMPDVVQNKFDIYRRGEQLSFQGDGDPLSALRDLNMTLVAYSTLSGWPFGFGALGDPFVHQLAAFFKVSPSTLLLRWALANGHAIIPRSKSPTHVYNNLNVLSDLPSLPHTAKDLLDGLVFLSAHEHGNDPSDTFGAFDSFGIFSSGISSPFDHPSSQNLPHYQRGGNEGDLWLICPPSPNLPVLIILLLRCVYIRLLFSSLYY